MKRFKQHIGATEVIAATQGLWEGYQDIELDSVCEASEALPGSVIFCEQERLVDAVNASPAGLIITNPAFAPRFQGRSLLICDKPYIGFMSLVAYWLKLDAGVMEYSIHPSAIIDSSARFEGEVSIGAYSVVGANVTLGKGVRIGAGCHIGENVCIGSASVLHDRVCLYADTEIGKNCEIHSGAVLGADGFGYLVLEGRQTKIPQVGNVVIHDDVEIGANSTIDRATLGSTVVGKGTKIDNLVQVGHNCVIGQNSVLCAQVGLAGSTIVGDYVYLAGQVGAAGHLSIGDGAMVGAQSGIAGSIPAGARYFGTPAADANQMKRVYVAQKYLPDMYRDYQKRLKDEK
ncbi:MAG: UDP-3-O-(3-hydroxymyristoyl)glucosamine N-acyltransferase [Candidatus Cloacimonetes bacterium]|jgi:UDP-3-O-[3-hydroxymyristoyl] glucosamine N-acyltransferase|nr:UDP-3-O-(3-hydroxymyristoyl)glucosamine N-acyltransferase [Candidatus Cloacimonadota bacterium]MDD4560048.1 UDP-3-O-(3-hydroxymyristoyl)glucosamine N-acyltransferase [Candidatus Cloacimonadota bacterium]